MSGKGPDCLLVGDLRLLEPPEGRVGEGVREKSNGKRPPGQRYEQLAEESSGQGETHEHVQVVEQGPGQERPGQLPRTKHQHRTQQYLDREPGNDGRHERYEVLPVPGESGEVIDPERRVDDGIGDIATKPANQSREQFIVRLTP